MAREAKLTEMITIFTDERKDGFFSNLSEKVGNISTGLDEQQASKLQAIPVADIVNNVTERVVQDVVQGGLALFIPGFALDSLTSDVVAQLVGKPLAREQAAKELGDQLHALLTLAYVSETAREIFKIINVCPPVSNNAADYKLKELVSATALEASPMKALHDSNKIRAMSMEADYLMEVGFGLLVTGDPLGLIFLVAGANLA
ncbi:hypothetical protein N7481_012153 [Penicillium waksmanii]|uniref:uncharacterized protein n=1 Tax=Penicillium waksmanii TaxID=69791 RepID=UPI0025493912|nr:uncharacterized protein N7481_012153 [Penicillium waksmanii]KAJ5965439.1 hypothetical protein N7481_012153 [Penicillium waksmanii]